MSDDASQPPYLVVEGTLGLRLMRDEQVDFELLARWLSDPRVLEFYEGRDNPYDLDRVRQKYSPRVQAKGDVDACIMELDRQPIGYVQFYRLPPESCEEYCILRTESAYGIDLFIGYPALWGKGHGTRVLRALANYLIDTLGASVVTIDPYVTNLRAIRSYEKAGFKKVRILPRHWLHEGQMRDSWLMVRHRSA